MSSSNSEASSTIDDCSSSMDVDNCTIDIAPLQTVNPVDEVSSSIDLQASTSGEISDSEICNKEKFPLIPFDSLIHKKPQIGLLFDTMDIGLDFYKEYGRKIGFDVNLSSQKRYNDGTVRLRYGTCSKAGSTTSFKNENIYENHPDEKNRRTASKKKQCPALSKFKNLRFTSKFYIYGFVEDHNHDLVSEHQLYLLRINRKVDHVDESFINKSGTHNVGPSKAFTLASYMRGGYDVSGGIAVDFKNFQRDLNNKIGVKDAQLAVNIMEGRKLHLPNFSFEVNSDDVNHTLTGLFWADDISKSNYIEFGDVVSFDATYQTNKYSMVFVLFTGIDNHKRCVTFAAGLLAKETAEAYVWLLKEFLKAFVKQPSIIVTDQDSSMKKAVSEVFPESKHRLCMWHITQKLEEKIDINVYNHPDFQKTFHDIVWNVQWSPQDFERNWNAMLDFFDLQGDPWLTPLFEKRESWIPAYMRDLELSGLMLTTSRSESMNYAFSHFLHHKSNLVKFMMSFDSAIEKQRHHQSLADYQSITTTPKLRTPLLIEVHAAEIYTRSVFLEIQKELYNSVFFCIQDSVVIEDDSEVYVLRDKKRIKKVVDKQVNVDQDSDDVYQNSLPVLCPNTRHKVVYKRSDQSISCSCLLFVQEGFLCRHMFYILNMKEYDKIPDNVILRRWGKDIITDGVLRKKYSYSHQGSKNESLIQNAYAIVRRSINKIANNEDELCKYVKQLELNDKSVPVCTSSKASSSRSDHIENILGAAIPDVVNIHNPVGIRNKGWASGRRMRSDRDIAIEKSKKVSRECSLCHKTGHNARSCIMRLNKPSK